MHRSIDNMPLNPNPSPFTVCVRILRNEPCTAGRNRDAITSTRQNLEGLKHVLGTEDGRSAAYCWLLMAHLMLNQANTAAATDLLARAHEWAIMRDARELVCAWYLIKGRVLLVEAMREGDVLPVPDIHTRVQEAANCVREGLKIATDCGYGILYLDLMLVLGRIHLYLQQAEKAKTCALVVLTASACLRHKGFTGGGCCIS